MTPWHLIFTIVFGVLIYEFIISECLREKEAVKNFVKTFVHWLPRLIVVWLVLVPVDIISDFLHHMNSEAWVQKTPEKD